MSQVSLRINGKQHKISADANTPLLWVLRDELGLTGTKYGCGIGACGACAVHLNGQIVRSCQVSLKETEGKSLTTIEGLSTDGTHRVQQAWIEEDVAQCGYCQAGMIMTAAALLQRNPKPSDVDIDTAMSDSVCRCGTYQRMRKAIHRAAGVKS